MRKNKAIIEKNCLSFAQVRVHELFADNAQVVKGPDDDGYLHEEQHPAKTA
jgi:hypothetical protein